MASSLYWFVRLAAFILANMESILQEWEDFARSLGAVTSSMDIAALRDHAELILAAIARDMETAQRPAEQRAQSMGHGPERAASLPPTAATSHGSVRAESGFTLAEMVAEYRALRASVLRLWASQDWLGDDRESYQQQIRFNEAIDAALTDSIKVYSQTVDQMRVTKARHRMEALGALAAGLGHDMANVLTPMSVCLDTLRQQGLTDGNRPLIEALERAVEHLRGLCTGLRALSMDADDAAAVPEYTVLHEWWASAISPFTWVLPKGVRLHTDGIEHAGHGLPPVKIPAHVLMQIVFNLVQNAAQVLGQRIADDPTRAPAGNIWIEARHVDAMPGSGSDGTPGAIQLAVRDDGPGMDAETLAHCTEAFFTRRPSGHGMGLGLFLVRKLVARHGGELIIESEVGKGSAFTVILPAAPLSIKVFRRTLAAPGGAATNAGTEPGCGSRGPDR